VRLLLDHRTDRPHGVNIETLVDELCRTELQAGRKKLSVRDVASLLEELESEGFCHKIGGNWSA
jgi:A/G-specific adenine glycosylase